MLLKCLLLHDWKQRLALASKVLKHPVVSSVMVVRVVVVGENRVGVRPLWTHCCNSAGLLLVLLLLFLRPQQTL
ncbi:hypothetical protein INR49_025166 [Caranx melampygus]|nr:hypothetical protein INR49_025166 [Caranx melampygus]